MSSHDMKNPAGGVHMGRVMESPDPNGRLLERILSRENMHKAWRRVKANKGDPGIDKMTIEESPEFARNKWDNIRKSLLAGIYQPSPVKRVEIPKPTGGTRPLGIPTVTYRIIQQAIYQVLMPIFDPGFSDYSYGFKPGKSAHDAVFKVREYICEGYRIAVDMDLSKFFDTVNHVMGSNGVKSAVDCYAMSFLYFLRGPLAYGPPISLFSFFQWRCLQSCIWLCQTVFQSLQVSLL
jgi:RNA-directed DNA polymerase